MTFLDGAWSIIILPVGRDWEFGSASTMPLGKRPVRRALKKPLSAAKRFSSLLFKDQGVFPGQTEGYSYLGGGIIFLVVVLLIFAPLSLLRPKIVSLWPLWLAAALSFTLAASAKITLGPHVSLDLPLPDTLERLLSTFRASGRLFWAGYYIILCCSFAAALPDLYQKSPGRRARGPSPRPDIRLQKSLCRSPWDA
jgi:hypothetical protein